MDIPEFIFRASIGSIPVCALKALARNGFMVLFNLYILQFLLQEVISVSVQEKTNGFFSEFKTFIARGNVMDMAVGVIIGGAFGKISTSLVNDIIMPAVSMLTGGVDFSNWKIVLKAAVAGADGAIDPASEVAIRYGSFLATILDFLIIAFAVFCLIKFINSLHRKKEEVPAAPPAPPEPSAEEKLLTEIRDLLKNK